MSTRENLALLANDLTRAQGRLLSRRFASLTSDQQVRLAAAMTRTVEAYKLVVEVYRGPEPGA